MFQQVLSPALLSCRVSKKTKTEIPTRRDCKNIRTLNVVEIVGRGKLSFKF